MSRDLGRDVPDLAKMYAKKIWADFPFAIMTVTDTDTDLNSFELDR